MLVEDERTASCGGDPFSYLKGVLKGVSVQLDQGQDAKVLVIHEKFPYERSIFEGLAHSAKLKLIDLQEDGPDLVIILRKPKG